MTTHGHIASAALVCASFYFSFRLTNHDIHDIRTLQRARAIAELVARGACSGQRKTCTLSKRPSPGERHRERVSERVRERVRLMAPWGEGGACGIVVWNVVMVMILTLVH